jgi:hypothetical protein
MTDRSLCTLLSIMQSASHNLDSIPGFPSLNPSLFTPGRDVRVERIQPKSK